MTHRRKLTLTLSSLDEDAEHHSLCLPSRAVMYLSSFPRSPVAPAFPVKSRTSNAHTESPPFGPSTLHPVVILSPHDLTLSHVHQPPSWRRIRGSGVDDQFERGSFPSKADYAISREVVDFLQLRC